MKKLIILAVVCCTVLFSGCNKPQETYNASLTYTFASSSNEASAKAIIGTIYDLWQGDFTYLEMTADTSDPLAVEKFEESLAILMQHANELKPYFSNGDNITYYLHRVTEGEVLICSAEIYLGEDGNLTTSDLIW